ncbi:hypothetical protein [Aeromicrobium sp. 9AM]|uniref:hypothetical protein n=1 Tax=Aeromicrobium sp. 9AM TaxID=2653126 RepID=UPI0012F3561C|nr:hypothetical protein [Aeromicrobium sp. 9AM]VXC27720.1 hypothetical protein AERO9AM_50587 [Aeromicrobium sp. 9AM]
MTFLQSAADTAEAAAGTSDIAIALVGLGGAIIGGLATFLGIWFQSARETQQARRDRLAMLSDSAIEARWQVWTLARKLEKAGEDAASDALRDELHELEISLMRAVTQMRLHASKRMSDAYFRTLNLMPQDDLMRSLNVFATVVRGEVSPSWRERRKIRAKTLD